jgi:hypothetical protein
MATHAPRCRIGIARLNRIHHPLMCHTHGMAHIP